MKLGICYNVFDGEELLEKSIESVKPNAFYICVVYQKISNFGDVAHPSLEKILKQLVEKKYVDELILYEPKEITAAIKAALVSPSARREEVGDSVTTISNQFFHELMKRDMGRRACLKKGCSHFMTMDTDEFYLKEQMATAMELIETQQLEGTACKMRTYFKNGNYELLPYDEVNWVPFIYICRDDAPLQLACPYPITVDPTRRLANITRFYLFPREDLEMHHMTLVRMNIGCKMRNVSNRDNHDQAAKFIREFESWTPEMGVIHPHPHGRRTFHFVSVVPNVFDVDLTTMCKNCYMKTNKRCSRCKSVAYCSQDCQKADWTAHKLICNSLK